MAKRTIKLNEPVRSDEPFDHGVRITYKGATIAQSADDVEYELHTMNTVVEENINVQLVNIVPPVLVPFKLINNTQDDLEILSNCAIMRVMNGGLFAPGDADFAADGNYILPTEYDNIFVVDAHIETQADKYDVFMNGVPVTYDGLGGYNVELSFTQFTAATHLTVTVNDKPANGK